MANMNTTMNPGSWLTLRAWIDNDGRHVWVAHDCATERVTTMLPWPIWHSTGREMTPSFSCDGCGVHTFPVLGVPDQEYRCMETFEFDGRWCERMAEHDGTHRNETVEWGVYR